MEKHSFSRSLFLAKKFSFGFLGFSRFDVGRSGFFILFLIL